MVTSGTAEAANVDGHSTTGTRSLAIRPAAGSTSVTVTTPTFIPPEAANMPGYELMASPTLYTGQRIRALLSAADDNTQDTTCRLVIGRYDGTDTVTTIDGPEISLSASATGELTWTVPDTGGQPIQSVGIALDAAGSAPGVIHLDQLTWDGEPDVTLTRPTDGGSMWRRAWVNAVDQPGHWSEAYRLVQNTGRGMLIHGTRDWHDYRATATLTPHLAEAFGLAVRVQGLRRYYALTVAKDGTARLVKSLDGEQILAEAPLEWKLGQDYTLALEVTGNRLRASIDGDVLFDVEDPERTLDGGGIALICDEGRVGCDHVRVQPLH